MTGLNVGRLFLEVSVRHRIIALAFIAAISLGGCQKSADGLLGNVSHHDRYIGVGTYPAGSMWSQMVVVHSSEDAAVAKLADDEQVVVVVDSKTGELRQCGNMTGYCVSMNPWAKPLTSTQTAPIRLAKHADELANVAAPAAAPQASQKPAP
jgi:hypothetical protein